MKENRFPLVYLTIILIIGACIAMAGYHYHMWQTVLFAFGVFIIAGMCMGFIWRYQRTRSLTEKMKSAEALHDSEERFRILFDKAPLSYQSLDSDGNFLDINQTWLETLGYRREEVIGKWFGDFLAKEEVEAFRERFPKFIASGKSHSEFEMIHKNGTNRFISFEGRVAKDPDGDFLQTHGILQDITEQKKSELERQVIFEITHGLTISSNLTELLKLIHQSLGKVVYVDNYFVALHDPNTGLFSFPYYEDQFDSVPEPVAMTKSCTAYVYRTGKPLLFTPELFRQLEEQNEVALIGSSSPSWIGVPLKTPARTIGVLVLQHYEKENVYSERDVQFLDSIGSHIAMAIDRRQAEEELRESEIKLKVILQSTADGILAIDSHGKVIKINRRFTELWQIPPALANSGDDQALLNFVLDQLTDADEFISKVKKLYHSTDEDLDHLHFRDGRIFERFSAPLVMPDSSIGRVWSFRDITAARRAEEEIQKRNKELSNSNAEKDKFFSIIAHDLRSPFSSFLGLTQIMAEELPRLTMAEVQDIAVSMSKSATNLYRLLENLLQWSQIQQGSIPFRQDIVHLRTIVDESIGMIHESAKIKEIELLTNDIDDPAVLADSNMIQAVIRNLLSNAVKFTPKRGKVSLSVKASNQTVEIAVHDSGIGMSPAMVDNLFRIDVRTNREGTEGEPSTGLGLLLCHEFIEKHGGKIWVESEVGKGSVFHFSLPEYKHVF
jgi:PAS domain S-box-containing protein